MQWYKSVVPWSSWGYKTRPKYKLEPCYICRTCLYMLPYTILPSGNVGRVNFLCLLLLQRNKKRRLKKKTFFSVQKRWWLLLLALRSSSLQLLRGDILLLVIIKQLNLAFPLTKAKTYKEFGGLKRRNQSFGGW